MVELKGICKTYNRETNNKLVLQNVNLKINRGDFVSIMGDSGSGKTTLLNILGGLDDASDGEYIFEGKMVSGLNGKKTDLFRREKISLVFQKYELLDNLNVEKNVEIPLRYKKMSRLERKKKIQECLEKVSLVDYEKRKISELSGGEQQRVAIARALAKESPLLLADEPTGALDKENTYKVMEIFKKLNQEGQTIVLVTHDPEIDRYAKRHFYIEDGKTQEV